MESRTNNKLVQCKDGDRLRITTSSRAEDPNVYRMVGKDKQLLSLLCEDTGKTIQVHTSRVLKNLSSEEIDTMTDSNVDATAAVPTTASKPAKKPAATKVTKVPKPKAEKRKGVRLDLKALVTSAGENAERFTKKNEFDHPGVENRAYIVVRGDHRAYVTFNTYNGCISKTSLGTETFDTVSKKVYSLADDAAYEKMAAAAKKNGYIKTV